MTGMLRAISWGWIDADMPPEDFARGAADRQRVVDELKPWNIRIKRLHRKWQVLVEGVTVKGFGYYSFNYTCKVLVRNLDEGKFEQWKEKAKKQREGWKPPKPAGGDGSIPTKLPAP